MDTKAISESLKNLQRALDSSANVSKNGPPGKDEITRADQATVFVRVVFLKIGEIKTVDEKFNADVFVQARWREPRLDGKGKPDEEFEVINRSSYWTPKLHVENCESSSESKDAWYMARTDANGKAFICERRRITGTFLENMELKQFPFDTQDLTITMTSDRGEHEVALEEDEEEISVINVQAFVDEQEWNLHSHIESWKKVTTNAYRNQKHKHPAVSLCCKASRRPDFFIYNFALVMCFICSLIFTTFAVSLTLVANRLQLSFILLLSNITFKFVVSQSLPKVSYLTVLDKYVLSQMSVLVVACIWHAIIFQFNKADFAVFADRIALGVLGVIYLFNQLGFLLYWKVTEHLKAKDFQQKDEQHANAIEKRMSMGQSIKSRFRRKTKKAVKVKPSAAAANV